MGVVVAHDAKVCMELRTPLPGAPRWAAERFRRLAEWFARSPFYAGRPLSPFSEAVRAGVGGAGDDNERHRLRDASGRCCCTMSVREMRRAIDGDAPGA